MDQCPREGTGRRPGKHGPRTIGPGKEGREKKDKRKKRINMTKNGAAAALIY